MKTRIIAILLAVLFGIAPARAEMRRPASDSAARLLADGNRYYKVRDFDKAIELYRQGALVEAAPVFWYNLGQAFRQQAKYKEAIWYYKRFLAEADGEDERRQAEHFIDQMQRELDRRAQSESPISPGPEQVAPSPASAPAVPKEAPQPPPPPTPMPDASRSASGASPLRIAGLTVGGAGAALIGVGLVFGARAGSQWSDAKAACDASGPPLPCSAAGVALHDDASRSATISTITIASGAVALAAGAAMFLLSPSQPRQDERTAIKLEPVLGANGAGLLVKGGY